MDQYAQIIGFMGPLFLAAIAVEFALDRRRKRGTYRLNDAVNSLSLGILSTYVRIGLRLLMLVPYAWVADHVAPWKLPADHWAVWVLAFVLYDFCYYWLHRLSHEWNFLWAVHVVHHQSEEFNLTTALRQAALVPLVAWPFYMPLALLGVPWEVTGVVSILQLLYQFWPHTRHVDRLGPLDRWVQTPSNHRVHHAQNDVYLDRNYGGILMLWDRMFGTFQDELREEPPVYGVRGQLKSWNPVWANWHVWQDMAATAWKTRSWGDKLRVWVARPGWRPADVPKAPYTLDQFRLYDPPLSPGLKAYVLAQFGAAYLLTAHYLKVIHDLSAWDATLYAATLTALLLTLGGLMEGRRVFLGLEAGRAAATGLAALLAGSWFGVEGDWVPLAGGAYAALSLAGLWAAAGGAGRAAVGDKGDLKVTLR